jgi:hypothetical protein
VDQSELLRYVSEVLNHMAIPYAIVGSWASGLYGEGRMTFDIDIVLDLKMFQLKEFCAAFATDEYYLSEADVREAILNRFQFNLIHPKSGNKVDFIQCRMDGWHANLLSRRHETVLQTKIGPIRCSLAAPEDVILGKLWYHSQGGGDRHMRDIASMVRISRHIIDMDEVTRWATGLGYLPAWLKAIAEAEKPDRPAGPGVP